MDNNCNWVEEKLVEYIDGELDYVEKSAIENHLKTCASCNEYYQQQKSWLAILYRVREYESDEKIVSPDLNSRIFKAVAEENKMAGSRIRKIFGWKWDLSVWKGVVAAAAAVVLVLGAVQVVSLFNNPESTDTGLVTARRENKDYVGVAGVEDGSAGGEAEYAPEGILDETEMARSSGSGWQLYSGSLEELPAAGDIFSDCSVPNSESTDESREIESLYGTFILFNEAQAIRVLYEDSPDARVMFLLLYPGDEAERWQAQLAESFGPCTHPYSIEIIEAASMTLLSNELGRDLFYEITSGLDLEQNTLIKILIEE